MSGATAGGALGTVEGRFAALKECTDPDAVARLMVEHNAKGTRRSPYACPVACFMGKGEGVGAVYAGSRFIKAWRPGEKKYGDDCSKVTWWFYTPPAVQDFIVGFDSEGYPALEADEVTP